MEVQVHALRAVKQEENPSEFDLPQSLNHTNERQLYHDPTMIEMPLAKFQRALNPLVEQSSAPVQTTPHVETDNVHHTNGLQRLGAVVASDTIPALELEEPPNTRATEKAQVVAEMVEYAFESWEGSNYNPGTRMMVSNLLQFLSKQYEEEKALAVVEIDRLKDEKVKLEEQRNLAVANFQRSESELEELKKKGEKSSPDLELENEELKTIIATMVMNMDAVTEKYNTVQSELLSTRAGIQKLKKEKLEDHRLYENALQEVNLLQATIYRDKKIYLQNEKMRVLRERVGTETCHIPETTGSNPPIAALKSPQVPQELSQCDPVTQETDGPKSKKPRCDKGSDSASVSISGSVNAIAPQKFGAELASLLHAIMTLGKALDLKIKALNMGAANPPLPKEVQWNLCISRIVPPGCQFDTNTTFKMVWNHWISAVMFHDFEYPCFGMKEAVGAAENLDALTKVGTFDGNCSRFLAFVKRKHQLLFPPWMYQAPLLKILDADVYSKFKVIAEKIWMLHQIGRRCELPPSIFRPVPFGTRYYTQYHESRTPLPQGTETEPHVIMLVFMPGFVVGETVIKSQVSVRKL